MMHSRYAEFVLEFGQVHQTMPEEEIKRFKKIIQFLNKKNDSSEDIPEVRSIKGLIRRGEARAGARFTGLPDERIHFLDMPFYETGRTRKKPLGEEDIHIVMELVERVKPHQIFAAGDLADPPRNAPCLSGCDL
jgi:glucosamine-6-phosphate deaminase